MYRQLPHLIYRIDNSVSYMTLSDPSSRKRKALLRYQINPLFRIVEYRQKHCVAISVTQMLHYLSYQPKGRLRRNKYITNFSIMLRLNGDTCISCYCSVENIFDTVTLSYIHAYITRIRPMLRLISEFQYVV